MPINNQRIIICPEESVAASILAVPFPLPEIFKKSPVAPNLERVPAGIVPVRVALKFA